MARTKAKPETPSEEEKKSPFVTFAEHQLNAVGEVGKAVASLLPEKFREHTGKAIEESVTGVKTLVDGVIDGVERGLEKLRTSPEKEAAPKAKVKVDVD